MKNNFIKMAYNPKHKKIKENSSPRTFNLQVISFNLIFKSLM